ncbi:MAG: DISARM system helicase DrmA [Actinomycetota bacterium]|nr:DISARM system helicase DrmA [Actinomycetota bacterium]
MTDPAGVGSYRVRAELEDFLERDLLGPWDGPEEELPPGTPPAERYILGRLVPCRPAADRPAVEPEASDADLVDRDLVDADDDPEAPESQASVRSGTMAASSLGLSFEVPDNIDAVRVTASWGRYQRSPSEFHQTEQGRPATVWRRVPVAGTCLVDLDVAGDRSLIPVPETEGVELRVTVRHRPGRRLVDLALVNGQPAPVGSPDLSRLYQVQLSVTAPDGGQAVFIAHNDPELGELPASHDDERLELALLYRQHRQYAHGRQCAVDADVRPDELRAWKLTTTSFPAADVPLTVPAGVEQMPGAVLDMARLGSQDLARDDLVRALRPLVTGYRTWLDEQAARLDSDAEIRRYGEAGSRMLQRGHQFADRLERAVDLLRDDPSAREAFRFANQAMALQRVRTELVRTRLAEPDRSAESVLTELDIPARRSWRPFQLAFVLLCLPGLTDPAHPDAHRSESDGQAQLLFFPTGGGKTESYLGLTAYTFAIRRLQGVVGTSTLDATDSTGRDGTDGVAVLMRYTLRLLTAQQFARAASLISACEALRRERLASGDTRWGNVPFRVGLWVGSSVTPNSFEEAQRQIDDDRGSRSGTGGVLQLVACPWCGSRLSYADLRTDRARRRVLLFCSDPEGRCLFTERQSPGEGIPVLTVDEELYRLTPSLVIATVDKLAQLPWKAATATLFGLVTERCPRHGWRNPDFDQVCRGRHPAASGLPATTSEPALPLRPPDLIIQDELHLISDALGSLVGLYETVIDRLASRPGPSGPIRPVLVASTATVRRAADQVEQVFARDLAVFPPQILDAGRTFFSTPVPPSPVTPARRYRGILASGERMTAIEIRVVAAVLEHAQALIDRHGSAADPYMTVVDYFTSTRDLASMRRLVDDDIADRLASRQVRTRRRRPNVAELTSRMPSARISATLADLEQPFDPTYDTSAALDALRAQSKAGQTLTARRPDGVAQPLDVLLATSMLQVGVDVPRLGLMAVTGQPKNTAEYIQATSRVGRDPARPGLVLAIYQWARPRDLAHYETFGHYHATFGAMVEGLTTTPFSDRALDRGLTGILVSAIRHGSSDALANVAAQTVGLDGAAITALVDDITRRALRVTHDQGQAEQVGRRLRHRLEVWGERRRRLATGVLGYEEGKDVAGLLRSPEDGDWDQWSVPRSLREVEPEILLQLQRSDHSAEDSPPWRYREPDGSAS